MSFLHCEEYGSGPPAVCIHGFGGSSYSWRGVIPSLAATHRVFALDLKGFGKSPKPVDGKYSLQDQTAAVLQFVSDLRARSITLVGHSFGGAIALSVAGALSSIPDAVEALVLIDALAYRQPMPTFIRVLRIPVIGPLVQHLLPVEAQVKSVLRLAYYNDGLIPDAAVEAYSLALKMPGGMYALRQTARQLILADVERLVAGYRAIRVPTLLVWGRHDEIVPLTLGQRLLQDIPHSRLVLVENAGHAPQEEAPIEVRHAIDEFLGNLK